MKRLFALLALCLPIYLFSQGFGSFSHDQPFFAKDRRASGSNPSIPEATPGLAFWWVARDVATNGIAVTNWYDRIQNVNMNNTEPGRQPAVPATNVVYFDGSDWLTNYPGAIAPNPFTIMWVIKHDVFQESQLFANEGAPGTFGKDGVTIRGDIDQSYYNAGSQIIGDSKPANTIYDCIIIATNTTGNIPIYTNGVQNQYFYTIPGQSLKLTAFAADPRNRNSFNMRGYIYEFMVWTNYFYPSNVAGVVSNLHYYATNTYGFSP